VAPGGRATPEIGEANPRRPVKLEDEESPPAAGRGSLSLAAPVGAAGEGGGRRGGGLGGGGG
jgi:hypothetical protein